MLETFFERGPVESAVDASESTDAVEDVTEAVSEEDFFAVERQAVVESEAALAARARLSDELEAERERQLVETFDGERIIEFEKRIAVAGKAIERARERLALANERLREKGAEHRRLLHERYRAQAVEAVDYLHRKLAEARRASAWISNLHKRAEKALGTGQRAIPAGIWFAGVLEDDRGPGDGGPRARWRRYADRSLRGEE